MKDWMIEERWKYWLYLLLHHEEQGSVFHLFIHPFNHHTIKAQFQRIFITGTNNLLLILESAVFLSLT